MLAGVYFTASFVRTPRFHFLISEYRQRKHTAKAIPQIRFSERKLSPRLSCRKSVRFGLATQQYLLVPLGCTTYFELLARRLGDDVSVPQCNADVIYFQSSRFIESLHVAGWDSSSGTWYEMVGGKHWIRFHRVSAVVNGWTAYSNISRNSQNPGL